MRADAAPYAVFILKYVRSGKRHISLWESAASFFYFFYGLQAGLYNGQKTTVHTAGYARKTAFFLMEIELTLIYNKGG